MLWRLRNSLTHSANVAAVTDEDKSRMSVFDVYIHESHVGVFVLKALDARASKLNRGSEFQRFTELRKPVVWNSFCAKRAASSKY